VKFATQTNGNVVVMTLNKPVPPGGKYSLTVELTVPKWAQPTGDPGVFEYQFQNQLGDDCITYSKEEYRLPPGAVLLAKHPADLKETTNDSRIELRIDRTIPPEKFLKTDLRYRLPAAIK
jgi:hypothetical protein